jgi:hypothetical protein
MCYEFSLWSRKLRSEHQTRQQAQKPEQATEQATKQPAPAPQVQPVAAEAKVQKRETIPA